MKHNVFLSLGSNIGDRQLHLEEATRLLNETKELSIVKTSSFYETDPVGYTDQDAFLNCVIEVTTDLEPYDVLSHCMHVEQELKRKRIIRWGPRTIDVDVLLYDDLVMTDEKLTIPHPRMHERAFVLIPLYELNQNIKIQNRPIKELIDQVSDDGIRKLTHEK